MINVRCYLCSKQIFNKAAVLLSPPLYPSVDDSVDNVDKFHFCKECFKTIKEFVHKLKKGK